MTTLSRAETKRFRKWLRWQQRRSCPHKIAHENRESARAHIERLVREQGEQRAALVIYHCLVCDKLHVGHGALFPFGWQTRRR